MLTEGLTLIIFMLRSRQGDHTDKTRDRTHPAPSFHQITIKFSDEAVNFWGDLITKADAIRLMWVHTCLCVKCMTRGNNKKKAERTQTQAGKAVSHILYMNKGCREPTACAAYQAESIGT